MHIRSFLNGVLAGIILGILFAPASGQETRRKLAKKADDIQDAGADAINGVIEKITDEETPVMRDAPDLVTLTALVVEAAENPSSPENTENAQV